MNSGAQELMCKLSTRTSPTPEKIFNSLCRIVSVLSSKAIIAFYILFTFIDQTFLDITHKMG